jgi:hypothetical protein
MSAISVPGSQIGYIGQELVIPVQAVDDSSGPWAGPAAKVDLIAGGGTTICTTVPKAVSLIDFYKDFDSQGMAYPRVKCNWLTGPNYAAMKYTLCGGTSVPPVPVTPPKETECDVAVYQTFVRVIGGFGSLRAGQSYEFRFEANSSEQFTGNPIPNVRVNISVDGNPPGVTLSAPYGNLTDENGQRYFRLSTDPSAEEGRYYYPRLAVSCDPAAGCVPRPAGYINFIRMVMFLGP